MERKYSLYFWVRIVAVAVLLICVFKSSPFIGLALLLPASFIFSYLRGRAEGRMSGMERPGAMVSYSTFGLLDFGGLLARSCG